MSRAKRSSLPPVSTGVGSPSAVNGASSSAAAAASPANDVPDDGLDGDMPEGEKKGVSAFISKIYKMVSDPSTQDIVCWNDRGDGFVVKNEFVFASQIMRSYFRHQNFSSFVRQLNFYGFHKRSSPSSLTSFYHPSFRKGHPELLSQIQRKSTESSQAKKDAGLREMVNNLTTEVAELRQQNEDLFKIQQRILYIFSRYMRATQAAQVGATPNSHALGGAGAAAGVEGSAAAKRIRGGLKRETSDNAGSGMKRARLLIEAKPNSPPANDSLFPSSTPSNKQYFHSSSGQAHSSSSSSGAQSYSPPSDAVFDLNTDQYQQQQSLTTTSSSYPSLDGPAALYGSHALSDLNWASDPNTAINDLLAHMPSGAQSILNAATPLPRAMGRPGGINVNTAGQNALAAAQNGQPYMLQMGAEGNTFAAFNGQNDLMGGGGHASLPLLKAGRGARDSPVPARGAAASNNNFLDFGAQMGNNPKQLLDLLDRMGADQSALSSTSDPLSSTSSSSGRARTRTATTGPGQEIYPTGDTLAISGVFEDADFESVSTPTSTNTSSRKNNRSGRGARRTSNNNKNANANATAGDTPNSQSSQSGGRSRRTPVAEEHSGAHLSPLEDVPTYPSAPTGPSPVLTSLPIPPSPISPFLSDEAAAAASSSSHAPAASNSGHPPLLPPYSDPSFSLLTSPNLLQMHMPEPSILSRGNSHVGSDLPPYLPPSPFQGASSGMAGQQMPNIDALLAPSHLLTSAPPSPSPFNST